MITPACDPRPGAKYNTSCNNKTSVLEVGNNFLLKDKWGKNKKEEKIEEKIEEKHIHTTKS